MELVTQRIWAILPETHRGCTHLMLPPARCENTCFSYSCQHMMLSVLIFDEGKTCPSVVLICVSLFFLNKFNFYLFIYFWVCWVFVSVRGLSLVVASGGHSSWRCAGLSLSRPLVAEHRLQMRRLSNCGSRAHLLRGMWDLPRPGLEPVSPASAGRLSTTAPPGKPCISLIISKMDHLESYLRTIFMSFSMKSTFISFV